MQALIPVDRPELAPGDSWTYQKVDLDDHQVIDRRTITVQRKNDTDYSIDVQNKDGEVAQGLLLSLDLDGVQIEKGERIEGKLLSFPLTQGKMWKGRAYLRNSIGGTGFADITYTVVGAETVEVPAGTFDAIKLHGIGQWKNENLRNPATRDIEVTAWYSPDVKGVVRYERKHPLDDSVDHWAAELFGFKVSGLKRLEQEASSAATVASSESAATPSAFIQLFDWMKLDSMPPVHKLPTHLKGRWKFVSTIDFREYANAWDLEITSQDAQGKISGFITIALPSWGTRPEANCARADRLPIIGGHDGRKIALLVKASQNGGGCQNYLSILSRGKDHLFEAGAKDGSWYRYLDPAD